MSQQLKLMIRGI